MGEVIGEPVLITCYYLGVKGGYYNYYGDIVETFAHAKPFETEAQAIAFRQVHDPRHRIECAQLIRGTTLLEEIEG
jgi:hypothetical protein